ncbi:MAG: hypothetical protein ACI867_001829 [Glaciecola sp.]|jgi:hypothetical protein
MNLRGIGVWGSAMLALALALAACSAPGVAVPASNMEALLPPGIDCPAARGDQPVPMGVLRVGYPDEPTVWLPAFADDVVADDLAALWGLPLFHFDESGQLRGALVHEAVVLGSGNGGWQVRLQLCPGTWSDGAPVVARDVTQTIAALRTTPAADLVAPIVDAVVDGPDVVLSFAEASGRWQHVLAEVGPILPAHVLERDGIEAFRDSVPVAGGAFALDSVEPGLSRSFVAHPGSVLGSPRTQRIEVIVVPRFELAIGLLADGELDLSIGHLAFEAEQRLEAVDGLHGSTARGGTLLSWRWQPSSGVQDSSVRASVHNTFDLGPFAQGLLDDQGRTTNSFVAQAIGPARGAAATLGNLPELVVAAPRWHEAPGLAARAVRDGIERVDGTVRTASEEADELVRRPLGDAHIVIRRLGPWPSLAHLAGSSLPAQGSVRERVLSADTAPWAGDLLVEDGLAALSELAIEVPLLELGVAHGWRDGVTGLVPSGWPGLGFANALHWAG